jgi:predicted component of type VI protein secretion system
LKSLVNLASFCQNGGGVFSFFTVSVDFMGGLLDQLANAGSRGQQIDEGALNFMLSVVQGVKPKDQLETMLAAQMAAIHMATMRFARGLARVDTIQQQDSAERALNKLARTYAMQMEALKRYRTGGEQKVTMQHVSVSEGGQAIVGNVTQAAGGTGSEKTTTPALTDTRQQAMPSIETAAQVLPLRTKKKDGGRSSA